MGASRHHRAARSYCVEFDRHCFSLCARSVGGDGYSVGVDCSLDHVNHDAFLVVFTIRFCCWSCGDWISNFFIPIVDAYYAGFVGIFTLTFWDRAYASS